MAVRNEESFITETIGSIAKQSYSNFEVIIVDDASTDSTLKRLKKIDDQRFIIISNQKSLGLPTSLNFAAQKAQGSFLARWDGDELSAPSRLEKQLDILVAQPEIDFVACGFSLIDHQGFCVTSICPPASGCYDHKTFAKNGVPFCHGSVIMRSQVFKDLGGYDPRYRRAQDLDLWLRAAEDRSHERFYVCQDILYTRRLDANRLVKRKEQRFFSKTAKLNSKLRIAGKTEKSLNYRTRKPQDGYFSSRRNLALTAYLKSIFQLEAGERRKATKSWAEGFQHNPFEPRILFLGIKLLAIRLRITKSKS